MRILLDECIDWRLARRLPEHDVRTARQMGWTAVQNGDLLSRASTAFEVFITIDRSLVFQQNLDTFAIAIVVLRAKTNRLADLEPLVPSLLRAVEAARPGSLQTIAE